MSATIILRNERHEVKAGMTILSALKKLDIPIESVLPTRQGELIPEDELIAEGDEIKLVAVISGG